MNIKQPLRIYLLIGTVSIAILFCLISILDTVSYIKVNRPYFFKKPLDDKYTAMDKDFYNFMKVCAEKIPAGSEALFYNSWPMYKEAYKGQAFFIFEYERQRAKYYLYPVKVNTFYYEDKVVKEGNLFYKDEDEMLKKVSYVISTSLDREFPGFNVSYVYKPGSVILSKNRGLIE